MNDVKQMFRTKFTNLGSKLRLDKNNENDPLALPSYADILYISSKNDKEVYSEIFKKMSTACVQNYFVTDEKKMKKNAWESLLNLLAESEKKLSENTLPKEIMVNSVKVLDEMSHATKEFERVLSSSVIKHFQDLSEDNALSITKKSLSNFKKEMKASTEKVHLLQDQLNSPSSDSLSYRKPAEICGNAVAENKLVSAQILEENTEKEWENKKDLYLTKLFAAEAEKFTTAEKYLEFFQNYLDYYTRCQEILTRFIPDIKSALDKNRHIYAFHTSLEDHLLATNRKLSYVLETCIQELDNEETLQHEGLFRISVCKTKMELLKNALNVMRIDDFITKGFDSAVYSGVLKQYLRELPNPLMTFELYDQWCEIGSKNRQSDLEEIMLMVRSCLLQMPHCYYDNLAYLMQFLKKITEYESVNKMSASNIGLMLGPTLIRNNHMSVCEYNEASVMMILGTTSCSILEFLIAHYSELFPDAPVYATVKKIRVLEIVPSSSPVEKDHDKISKTNKVANDSDSQSSTDLLTDDSVSTTGAESNESIKSNRSSLKSYRDVPTEPKTLRKVPPPPQNKPFLIENDRNNIPEVNNSRSSPVIKRMSKLEKEISDPEKYLDLSLTDSVSGRAKSIQVVQRPNHLPTIPVKKVPGTEKPPRPENLPPKRPSNPPPHIPSFDKMKENLNQKSVEPKIVSDNVEALRVDGECSSL